MRRLPLSSFCSLLLLAGGVAWYATAAWASQIVPIPLASLPERSEVIALGHVQSVTQKGQWVDEVVVRLAAPLKGKVREGPVTLTLHVRNGPKSFDPDLRAGDRGVFFLRSVQGRLFLAYPGSVTVFPKGGAFTPPAD